MFEVCAISKEGLLRSFWKRGMPERGKTNSENSFAPFGKEKTKERILLRYATKHCVRKTVLPLSQKGKVNCVILRRTYRDFPAKNLESYLCAKILRKKWQEAKLRMTVCNLG